MSSCTNFIVFLFWKNLNSSYFYFFERGEINLTKTDFVNGQDSWFQLQSREYRVDKVHGDIELKFSLLYI